MVIFPVKYLCEVLTKNVKETRSLPSYLHEFHISHHHLRPEHIPLDYDLQFDEYNHLITNYIYYIRATLLTL